MIRFQNQQVPQIKTIMNVIVKSNNKTKKINTIVITPVLNFPLKSGHLGYMNDSYKTRSKIGFDNPSLCYTSFTSSNINKRLKMNSYCILRLGVEKNNSQSFLCLLASVFPYYKKRVNDKGEMLSGKIANLNEFKSYFLNELTVEKFIQAQNGVLLQVFKDDNRVVDISKYENKSKIIKSFASVNLKTSIIQSYENFIDYFNDDNEFIDYTYIWDFVTNTKSECGILFDEGINLLIFSNPNDDITNKIQLICPTNHYSDNFYNENRKTLMVYSKNNFFEPLCKVYTKSSTKFVIYRFLSGRFWDTLDEWREKYRPIKYDKKNKENVKRKLLF